MSRFRAPRCRVPKHRYNTLVLHPLGEDQEKIAHLRGKEVYVIVLSDE